MHNLAAALPQPQVGRPRSGRGTCVLCKAPYADLLDHIRKSHTNYRFTQAQLLPSGLIACGCGTACKNDAGLRRHALHSGCRKASAPRPVSFPRPPPSSPPPLPPRPNPRPRFLAPRASQVSPSPDRSQLIPTQPQRSPTNSNRFSVLESEDDDEGAESAESEEVLVVRRQAPVEKRARSASGGELEERLRDETPPWDELSDMDIDQGSEDGAEAEKGGQGAVARQETGTREQEKRGVAPGAQRTGQSDVGRVAVGARQADKDGQAGASRQAERREKMDGRRQEREAREQELEGEDSGMGTDGESNDNSGTLFQLGDIELTDIYSRLASLPARHRPLHPALSRAFTETAERIAERFLAQPSDRTMLEFLGLPKVGLSNKNNPKPTHRLAKYPFVAFPPSFSFTGPAHPPSAERQVELGRLGNASRILGGRGAVAAPTPAVVASLSEKHPRGTSNPFGSGPGPHNCSVPALGRIREAVDALNNDSSPGIAGWTPALLKIAVRSDAVAKLLHTLCGLMLSGKAPGQAFLCSSQLIALNKPDGGLRPIAIGESIYRLCMKLILKHALKPDFLAPFQFGVGSKGGVEPIVRAVERAVEGSTAQGFTHLTSLDFSNAFNTVDRKDIAAAVRSHAPPLFRLAKWAYNQPSQLIFSAQHGNGPPPRLLSAQGVRQGDPLGPLFFSLAVRPLLQNLSLSLGPSCTLLAYLDDIYILSNSADTLTKAAAFFDTNGSKLKLNLAKSSIKSLADVKLTGVKMLGTFVGPRDGRARFLKGKINELEEKVQKLGDLPSQHALLLLRQCMQQDLRHLQRSLRSDDLGDLWAELDMVIWDAAARIRAAQGTRDFEKDKVIFKLPARMGGLGLLSHQDCAPLAFATASESSDLLLTPLLGPPPSAPLLSDNDDPDSIVPQRTRCAAMFATERDRFFASLDQTSRQTMLESSTTLGRRWLNVIPFSVRHRLSNFEVSAALHIRSLRTGNHTACQRCGELNVLGHDEICGARDAWRVARHEQVKRVLTEALGRLPGVQATMEPFIGRTYRRNDIKVTGSRESGISSCEYDITVISLATQQARSTSLPLLEGVSPLEHTAAVVDKHLDSVAERKRRRLPEGVTVPFYPIVFSLGGRMDAGTDKEMRQWKAAMPDGLFSHLVSSLSLILLRARARNFDL